MKTYGKSLVNAVPDEATKVLKVLCTDYRPSVVTDSKSHLCEGFVTVWQQFTAIFFVCSLSGPTQQSQKVLRAPPEEFIHIFVHQKPKLIDFLEHMVQVRTT